MNIEERRKGYFLFKIEQNIAFLQVAPLNSLNIDRSYLKQSNYVRAINCSPILQTHNKTQSKHLHFPNLNNIREILIFHVIMDIFLIASNEMKKLVFL